MSANSFGQHFKVTSFGESHGSALGVVIEGCPSGINWDADFIQSELNRRRPGFHGAETQKINSQRGEADQFELLSGVFQGKTLGTPIAMLVRNQDARSADYENIAKQPRTGHADDVWKEKFGVSDPRGGGRSSGRETIARVMAGAVAKLFLRQACPELRIRAFVSRVGDMHLTSSEIDSFCQSDKTSEDFLLRMPSNNNQSVFEKLKAAQEQGQSFSGQVSVCMDSVPASLGQPVFHKLKADLAAAMMSIGATYAFQLGRQDHLQSAELGTEFHNGKSQQQYGGIRGGISTGENIYFNVDFKPTSSILDVAKKGRHDPCIVIRATPVVESMAALVIADHLLWAKLDKN